jgi:hypothetical protein
MNTTPSYIIELEQAFEEGLSSAIPVIVKQVDKERTDMIIDKLNDLFRTSQYMGATTPYLDGIRQSIEAVKEIR